MDNNIDRLFENKLRAFEKSPSSDVWERINGRLDGQEEKKKGIWWYSIAASLVLFTLGSIVVYNSYKINDISANHITSIKEVPDKEIVDNGKKSSLSTEKSEQIANNEAFANKATEQVHKKRHVGVQKEVKEILPLQPLKPSITESEKVVHVAALNPPEAKESQRQVASNLPGAITVIIKRGNSSIVNSTEAPRSSSILNSKLGRVYTQVVKFKNGEKVDFEEFTSLLATNKKEKQTQNK